MLLNDKYCNRLNTVYRKIKFAYNVDGLLLCWYLIMSSLEPKPIEKLKMKLTTKADRYSSARY
jgi:hypothetical protein